MKSAVNISSGSGGGITLHLSAREVHELFRLVVADNVARRQRTLLEYVLGGALREYDKQEAEA